MLKFCSFILLISTINLSSATRYNCSTSAPCGCSANAATLTRIVGGEMAGTRTWGWAVSLNAGGALCGGTIISSLWVLTAAHCVNGVSASRITVYAGSNSKLTGSQTQVVGTVYVHPSYNSITYENDIALLRLSSALSMSDPAISVICIPSVNSVTLSAGEWPSATTTVVAVGWGRLKEGGSTSSTLQQVTMQTIDYRSSKCTPVLNNWSLQFCATATCKDTCQGDSGGPLMAFTSSNQWVLVGITSSGIGCARAAYAGSYTRVAAFQSWISSTTTNQYTNPTSSGLISVTTDVESPCTASNHKPTFAFISLILALRSLNTT